MITIYAPALNVDRVEIVLWVRDRFGPHSIKRLGLTARDGVALWCLEVEL